MFCKQCGKQIPDSSSFCPECGATQSYEQRPVFTPAPNNATITKVKKPVYKKWWFWLLLVLGVAIAINSIKGGAGKKEKIVWSDIKLCSVLPEPQSNVGEIILNSEDDLCITVYKISEAEYEDYLAKCASYGFTIESDNSGMSFYAYNEAGYYLSLIYFESKESLSITLDAPMEMTTLQWPTSEIAKLLPMPDSNVGKIISDTSNGFFVYVGNTPIDSYATYVNACTENGFNVDYEKGDKYYYANNVDGYRVSINYKGNSVMSIEISAPSQTTPESQDEPVANEEEPPVEEKGTNNTELVDGMRPEFKEAMDSYEAFYDDYCEFIKQYNKNPSDLKLVAKYTDMMSNAIDMDEKFDAWDEEEMNDEELKYYLEVSNRISIKMLETAQDLN